MNVRELAMETSALLGRHIRHLLRIPEKLLSLTMMPVAYVVIFGVLFGSAMSVPGVDYLDYLMAGILAQTMLMNVSGTALGVADDLAGGIVDRFRSLPIGAAPVMIARTTSNLLLSLTSAAAMALIGFAIGWRVHTNVLAVLAGFGILALLGLTMAWLGALLGLALRSPEVITPVAFVIVAPITFLSNAFIPLGKLPGWLQAVCAWNPVSAVIAACRDLFGNAGSAALRGMSVFGSAPIPWALLLTVLLLAIFAPLTTRAYRSAVAR
ncbi:ABC transporter permease [Sciscionella marina]|uniref:ABC transporter permease n=1 Tax=Sciscionella marina TaxID=508770 RepID=UPI0003701DE1|nr:ABC transporter permease [Sciscionella marina]